MNYQLDLFEEVSELKILEERDRQIQQEVTNIRRGLFGRLGKVYKWMIEYRQIQEEYGNRLSAIEKRLAEKEREVSELKQTISWMESVA
ncbi:MAG: hypothetical protein PVF17_00490 [Ignavibacteria bacterium]|jgi:hypothetical protein